MPISLRKYANTEMRQTTSKIAQACFHERPPIILLFWSSFADLTGFYVKQSIELCTSLDSVGTKQE